MSRKHFEAIAEVLREQYDRDYGDVDAQDFIEHLTHLLAARLQTFNGRFQPQKFVKAVTGE